MTSVQVHPTGLVHPGEPDAKVKFLAAEALRGVGGILLDANGERFCDELGRRDYVSGEMNKGKGPFRLILNGKASKEIEWHCKHYVGRGIMKKFRQRRRGGARDRRAPREARGDLRQVQRRCRAQRVPLREEVFPQRAA
jgi:succinate dehydrogenase/fumarate reductase flavoprotein subunit